MPVEWTPAQFAENRFPTLSNWMWQRRSIRSWCSTRSPDPQSQTRWVETFSSTEHPGRSRQQRPSRQLNRPRRAAALNALRAIQTFDDKVRGTLDAMAYSASVGVTTNVDMGGFVIEHPNIEIQACSIPWRAGTPSPPTTRSSRSMSNIWCRCTCASFLSMDHNPDVRCDHPACSAARSAAPAAAWSTHQVSGSSVTRAGPCSRYPFLHAATGGYRRQRRPPACASPDAC